jgi:hypothetical protein
VVPYLNLFLKNKKIQKVVGTILPMWQGGEKLYLWVVLNHYSYIYIYKKKKKLKRKEKGEIGTMAD